MKVFPNLAELQAYFIKTNHNVLNSFSVFPFNIFLFLWYEYDKHTSHCSGVILAEFMQSEWILQCCKSQLPYQLLSLFRLYHKTEKEKKIHFISIVIRIRRNTKKHFQYLYHHRNLKYLISYLFFSPIYNEIKVSRVLYTADSIRYSF